MLKGDVVFLLDVDNTLIDNDQFTADLETRLEQDFGAAQRDRYWRLFNALRQEIGRADYLATLQSFRTELEGNAALLRISEFLLEYPFAQRLYPLALSVLAHLTSLGKTVILSDGDIVFQPRKIQRSGLSQAVDSRVLIYLHKDKMLDQMQRLYPAANYVMIDDKSSILAAMKQALGQKLTTIWVRQGHYARDASATTVTPPPDCVIDHIGDLLKCNLNYFLTGHN